MIHTLYLELNGTANIYMFDPVSGTVGNLASVFGAKGLRLRTPQADQAAYPAGACPVLDNSILLSDLIKQLDSGGLSSYGVFNTAEQPLRFLSIFGVLLQSPALAPLCLPVVFPCGSPANGMQTIGLWLCITVVVSVPPFTLMVGRFFDCLQEAWQGAHC